MSRWRFRSRSIRALVLALAVVAGMACAGDTVVVPESDAPFFYLVLNFRTISTYAGLDGPHQLALLLTTGPVLEPSPYRTAERFDMRRVSDGARFDWREYADLIAEPGTSSSVHLLEANYHLPDASGPYGLGADSIRPGETYTIEIETEGVTLRGEATVPEDFTVSVVVRDGRRVAEWPRVKGAAGYFVGAGTEFAEPQTDTFYVIRDDIRAGEKVRVTALDANLFRYSSDDELDRAGIDAGFGVFGAVSSATATVPVRVVSPGSSPARQGVPHDGSDSDTRRRDETCIGCGGPSAVARASSTDEPPSWVPCVSRMRAGSTCPNACRTGRRAKSGAGLPRAGNRQDASLRRRWRAERRASSGDRWEAETSASTPCARSVTEGGPGRRIQARSDRPSGIAGTMGMLFSRAVSRRTAGDPPAPCP